MLQGGDLRAALTSNPTSPALRWYNSGAQIALDIIKGLHFLHSHKVSCCSACHFFASPHAMSRCRLPSDNHAGRLPPSLQLVVPFLSQLVSTDHESRRRLPWLRCSGMQYGMQHSNPSSYESNTCKPVVAFETHKAFGCLVRRPKQVFGVILMFCVRICMLVAVACFRLLKLSTEIR